ncbi:MAG TPA: transcription termination factor NusA [Candidatus Tectomicrobia bacterium]|nr:transcription termination factor NusA [Candidatus Tectomicrobia bacterium]
MNQEILRIIEQISREKGIEKDVLLAGVEAAVLSAAKRRYGPVESLQARFNTQTGTLELTIAKTVVGQLSDPKTEIGLEQATAYDPEVKIGDVVQIPLEVEGFGRIAAQTAKQVIIQKVREAERDIIYNEYKGREGELVNGIIQRFEKGDIILDLGKTEALLPRKEQSMREAFQRGERLRAYILEVRKSTSGPQIIISRTHPGLVERLFEMEVPEIYEGIIEIKGAVREPNGRAKIAVYSRDRAVDPIGACVGMRGVRVQSVVQELRGEKIDIVQWSDDPATFVANALSPAKIYKINVNPEARAMEVIVEDDQLSLAIGKKGQNVRLAAKLTKWRLDIKSRSEYEQGLRTTAEGALARLVAAPVGEGEIAAASPDVSTPTDADLNVWPLEGEKPGPTEAPEAERMVDATADDDTHELEL